MAIIDIPTVRKISYSRLRSGLFFGRSIKGNQNGTQLGYKYETNPAPLYITYTVLTKCIDYVKNRSVFLLLRSVITTMKGSFAVTAVSLCLAGLTTAAPIIGSPGSEIVKISDNRVEEVDI